jgi:hypothetical protein
MQTHNYHADSLRCKSLSNSIQTSKSEGIATAYSACHAKFTVYLKLYTTSHFSSHRTMFSQQQAVRYLAFNSNCTQLHNSNSNCTHILPSKAIASRADACIDCHIVAYII